MTLYHYTALTPVVLAPGQATVLPSRRAKGGSLEHNYGHGKRHLAHLLVSLTLLAFLAYTMLALCDRRYRAARERLPSRCTYFEHLHAVTLYWPIDSWERLFHFMHEALERAKPPPTGRAAAPGRQI